MCFRFSLENDLRAWRPLARRQRGGRLIGKSENKSVQSLVLRPAIYHPAFFLAQLANSPLEMSASVGAPSET